MTTLLLCVAGFLVLVALARAGRGRRSRRARWPTPGVRITRGPLTRGPTAPAWEPPWSRPWR